jgi:ribosome assembly protein RRB1
VGDFKKSQLLIEAHTKDVNVIDWNAKASHLLASGSDDCTVKVWDLRMLKKFKKGIFEELICFSWHEEPITSIAFQPNEESVIAVASEDNRISIWDLAVENENEDKSIPNELMFVHQGQEEIKELRYHPVYYEMLVSTAASGINAFKPSFTGGDDESNDDEEDLKRPPIR